MSGPEPSLWLPTALPPPPKTLEHIRGCCLSSLPVLRGKGVQGSLPHRTDDQLGLWCGTMRQTGTQAGCACLLYITFHSHEESSLRAGCRSTTSPCPELFGDPAGPLGCSVCCVLALSSLPLLVPHSPHQDSGPPSNLLLLDIAEVFMVLD